VRGVWDSRWCHEVATGAVLVAMGWGIEVYDEESESVTYQSVTTSITAALASTRRALRVETPTAILADSQRRLCHRCQLVFASGHACIPKSDPSLARFLRVDSLVVEHIRIGTEKHNLTTHYCTCFTNLGTPADNLNLTQPCLTHLNSPSHWVNRLPRPWAPRSNHSDRASRSNPNRNPPRNRFHSVMTTRMIKEDPLRCPNWLGRPESLPGTTL